MGPFNITYRYNGTLSANQKAAFEAAAARWKQVITLGLSQANGVSIKAGECSTDFPAFSGSIASVLIDVEVVEFKDPITGKDNTQTLAEGGPCLIDTSRSLSRYGQIRFNAFLVPDLEKTGQLTLTITHEIGHVLGFGTLWGAEGNRSLIIGQGGDTNKSCRTNPQFVGSNAIREWHSLGGSGNVPLENGGGYGTCDGHWRESIFGIELMTGYLSIGSNPLSRLTIAAMQDLGYGVNYAVADAYSLPTSGQSIPSGQKLEMKPIKPMGVLP